MENYTLKFNFALILLLFATINAGCSSTLTGETNGEITSVVLDRDTKTKKKKTSSNKTKKTTTTSVETEISYRYTINGRSYEGYIEKDGDVQRDFQTGSRAVICYNPNNPGESDVFTAGHRCGG